MTAKKQKTTKTKKTNSKKNSTSARKRKGTSLTDTSTATAHARSEKTSSAEPKLTKYDIEFINSDGGIPSFRKELVKLFYDKGLELVVLEPGVFDYGVKRFGKKRDGYVVVYDYDKTAEALAKDYLKTNSGKGDYTPKNAYADAIDWLDFNTVRGIPYMGAYAPKMVYTDERGRERVAAAAITPPKRKRI